MGTFSVIVFVSFAVISTSRGSTCEYAGISSTSSKVKPSPKNLFDLLLAGELFIVAIGKDKRKSYATKTAVTVHAKFYCFKYEEFHFGFIVSGPLHCKLEIFE
jgi:hypothetical protein